MTSIAISYRRSDGRPYARALRTQLARHFGNDQVFFDTESIEPGATFQTVILSRFASADVVLVVISPSWLKERDEAGRWRLEQVDDFVRQEIEAALISGKRVIPILVDGAPMPKVQDLPGGIQALAECQAFELTDLDRDTPVLVSKIAGRIDLPELLTFTLLGAAVAPIAQSAANIVGRMVLPEVMDANAVYPYVPSGLCRSVAMGLYYSILAWGVMVGARHRLGWRMDQISRIAGGTLVAIAISDAILQWLATSFHLGRTGGAWGALQYGLWISGLSIGLALGIQAFGRKRRYARLEVAGFVVSAVAAAVVGGFLLNEWRNSINEWLAQWVGLGRMLNRSLFWLPMTLVMAAFFWLRYYRATISAWDWLRTLACVAAACTLADTAIDRLGLNDLRPTGGVNPLPSILFGGIVAAVINPIFYAAFVGVAGFELNRLSNLPSRAWRQSRRDLGRTPEDQHRDRAPPT